MKSILLISAFSLIASTSAMAAPTALCGEKSLEAVVALAKVNGAKKIDYELVHSTIEVAEDMILGTYTLQRMDSTFEVKTMEGDSTDSSAPRYCYVYSVVQTGN